MELSAKIFSQVLSNEMDHPKLGSFDRLSLKSEAQGFLKNLTVHHAVSAL